MIDKYMVLPVLACAWATIGSPIIAYVNTPPHLAGLEALMEPHPENKYFWIGMAAISVLLVMQNWPRLARLTWAPHLQCLLAYLVLAGVSVLWAFKPEMSFIRWVNQVIIVSSIVLPALLAGRAADLMRCMFLCFALACLLNVPIVFNQEPNMVMGKAIGYPGYFSFKGVLGECAALTFLLSLNEILYPGRRRVLGLIVIPLTFWIMHVSGSKGSLGFAIISPLIAGMMLIMTKMMRISPAIIILTILILYVAFSTVSGFSMNKLSYYIYGNYDFSGREYIWNFAKYEIGRRPLFGWGYQSFWLVGTDAPSYVEAPGWIATMPSAHSGYMDTKLETGYVGFVILLAFIFTTFHAIGRVVDRDRARAWILLTLAVFVAGTNFLETIWLRGMETMWLVFLMVAAEAGRFWHAIEFSRLHKGGRGAGAPLRPSTSLRVDHSRSDAAFRNRASPRQRDTGARGRLDSSSGDC